MSVEHRNLARWRGFWSQMSHRWISSKLPLALAPVAAALPGVAAAAEPQIVPIAHYTNSFRIAATGETLLGARSRITTADLRVSTGDARPVRISGAKPLPEWAMPHLGTTAAGHRAAVYPRCAGRDRISTCDLYSWDLDAGRETKLAGASRPGIGETEGVLDGGALVFTRWTSPRKPIELQDGNESTALYFRSKAGAVRSVGAGGQQLALSAGWIAQVRDTVGPSRGKDAPSCGNSVVELVRTDGTRRVPVRSMRCGSIKTFQSPTFIGGSLMFGATGTDEHPNGLLYRYDRGAGRTFAALGPSRFDQFVATSDTSGYATWQADQLGGGTDVIRVSGLVYDREVTTPSAARKPTL